MIKYLQLLFIRTHLLCNSCIARQAKSGGRVLRNAAVTVPHRLLLAHTARADSVTSASICACIQLKHNSMNMWVVGSIGCPIEINASCMIDGTVAGLAWFAELCCNRPDHTGVNDGVGIEATSTRVCIVMFITSTQVSASLLIVRPKEMVLADWLDERYQTCH